MKLARIWEELGEGKSDQNILYRFFGGGGRLSFFIQQKSKKNTKNWSSSSQMMPGTGCCVFLSIGSCCYGNKRAPFLEAQISIPGSRKVANSSLLLTMRSFCSLGLDLHMKPQVPGDTATLTWESVNVLVPRPKSQLCENARR